MEEVLHRCNVTYKKRNFDCLVTPDRLVLHVADAATTAENTEIFPMTAIAAFVPNKPRPELAHQKVLLKLSFTTGSEIVLDFQGNLENQRRAERALREHAGDRATERAARRANEEAETARRRAKFLHDRPGLRIVYEALVEKDQSLTPQEFWTKYDPDTFDIVSPPSAQTLNLDAAVPRPVNPQSGAVLTASIAAEKKREIFAQFPQVEKLYKSAVPELVTETDFWRRFHACQFFWKQQGRQRETARDLLFDSLLSAQTDASAGAPQPALPGFGQGHLRVSPVVDLCADYLGDDRRKDRASESGEKANPEAFASLVSRFNKVGERRFPSEATADTVERAAEERLRALEEELDGQALEEAMPGRDSGEWQGVELAKLLASHREVKTENAEIWRAVQTSQNYPQMSREGTANDVTLFLSQHLKSTEDHSVSEEKMDKWGRAMMASDFNRDFDIVAEQINELLRHFWTCSDQVKRTRLIAALLKKRTELESLIGRAAPMWTPSLKALLNAIEWADKISRKVDK